MDRVDSQADGVAFPACRGTVAELWRSLLHCGLGCARVVFLSGLMMSRPLCRAFDPISACTFKNRSREDRVQARHEPFFEPSLYCPGTGTGDVRDSWRKCSRRSILLYFRVCVWEAGEKRRPDNLFNPISGVRKILPLSLTLSISLRYTCPKQHTKNLLAKVKGAETQFHNPSRIRLSPPPCQVGASAL